VAETAQRRKAADTRSGPALTCRRALLTFKPLPVDSDMFELMSSSAIRSPLMETSICSFRLRRPITPPLVAACSLAVNT